MRQVLLSVLGLLASLLAEPGRAAEPLVVGVTVAPQGYLVERLAGESVEVVVLVPAGSGGEAEHYSPTPAQLRSLERCGLYFKVGHGAFGVEAAHIEPFLARHPELRQVSLAARSADRLPGDPHLWLSPRLMRRASLELAQALGELMPDQAGAIPGRLQGLLAEIDQLDAELRGHFAGAAGRRFVVNHASLGYLARDYGLEQRAIEEHGRAPSALRLRRVVQEAAADGVRVILVQAGFPRASAELVARDTGARLEAFDPLAADWLASTRQLGRALAEALSGESRP